MGILLFGAKKLFRLRVASAVIEARGVVCVWGMCMCYIWWVDYLQYQRMDVRVWARTHSHMRDHGRGR